MADLAAFKLQVSVSLQNKQDKWQSILDICQSRCEVNNQMIFHLMS